MESWMHGGFFTSPPKKTLVASRQFDAGSRTKAAGAGANDPFGDTNEDRRISGASMNKRGSQGMSQSQSQSQGRERGSQSYSQSQRTNGTATTAPTRPKPRKRTATTSYTIQESPPWPPPPRKSKEKEDVGAMVAKWKKVSQQDESESDDDGGGGGLGIDFSQSRKKSGATTAAGKGNKLEVAGQGQGRKIKLILSPESRTKQLPATTTTSSHKDTSSSDDDEYLLLSQDAHQPPNSSLVRVRPSRHLLPEVMIGTGDGASLLADSDADAEGRSLPTTATREGPAPAGRRGINLGNRASIGYSSDEDGGVRDDSFDLVFGKSQFEAGSQSQSKVKTKTKAKQGQGKTTTTAAAAAATTKGKKKVELYDPRASTSLINANGKNKSGNSSGLKTTTATKATSNANVKSSSSIPKSTKSKSKSKSTKTTTPASSAAASSGKGKAKSRGKVIVSASEDEDEDAASEDDEEDDSDDSGPALRFDRRGGGRGDSERTPRPRKRIIETVPAAAHGSKKNASSSKRRDRSPERLQTAATTSGVSGRKRKMADMRDTDGLGSDDDDEEEGRTPMQRRKIAAASRDGVSARQETGKSSKAAATMSMSTPPRKKKSAAAAAAAATTPPPTKKSTTATTKGKEPPRKVALPEGFPSPMRAPVRPNEQLLSSPTFSPGRREEEKQERPADVGPNGAQMLPVSECVMADVPTLQLPSEKVPQLVARNIVDDKCPYCQEFLPVRMSESVSNLYRQLRATDAPRRTSTAASDADWTRTIEFCQRHYAESHVFPLGFHAGYPHELNFSQLKARVKALKPEVKKMLKRPKDSAFYLFAERDLENQGRRKWSSMESANDEKRKDRLLPGYFGPLGKITIGNVLKGMLRTPRFKRLTTPEAIGSLLPEEYVEHVLVIEVALLLISQDMQQEKEDREPFSDKEKRSRALQILKESREYGRTRFGIGSKYIAEEDWGNGVTQMVIADVRGLNDDSEEESDDHQATSSEPEPEPEPELLQLRYSSPDGLDDASESGNRATRSSPHRIEDDEDDVDMIRPASTTPEILPSEVSPVLSFGGRNSKALILAVNSDEDTMLGSSPRPRKIARQNDHPVTMTVVSDSDDEFDNPAVALDAQSVIEAADEVEQTFNQREKHGSLSATATTAKKRPAPKFVEVVDVTSSPNRIGAQSHSLRSSARGGTSSTGPPSRRKFNLNGGEIVHDLDGDDPMDGNIGRQHHNLIQRTQTRPVSAGGLGQRGGRPTGSTLPSRSGTTGNGYTSTASGPRTSELVLMSGGSPYHLNNAMRKGARPIGLPKNSGPTSARAPNSAGSSAAPGSERGRAGGDARRGGGAGLFHKSGKQALERQRQDQAVWDKKNGR
ncbi:hypothetical protein QFC21_003111 [Naganishia friedmannii]|uniref:Uncharacterized protein n=1 Tax=Naganishia friedmannii TaxID=89922 RepID=A0ACC2VSA0_9TREE|nr:hypothetical protein QFC21_003111 [Naganishia friedmannii]